MKSKYKPEPPVHMVLRKAANEVAKNIIKPLMHKRETAMLAARTFFHLLGKYGLYIFKSLQAAGIQFCANHFEAGPSRAVLLQLVRLDVSWGN